AYPHVRYRPRLTSVASRILCLADTHDAVLVTQRIGCHLSPPRPGEARARALGMLPLRHGVGQRLPLSFGRSSARNLPVYELAVWATASGGPSAMTSPPSSPPSGPRSMTQSAALTTSRWCSTP